MLAIEKTENLTNAYKTALEDVKWKSCPNVVTPFGKIFPIS